MPSFRRIRLLRAHFRMRRGRFKRQRSAARDELYRWGMLTGLSSGSLVLLDNGADALTVSSSGAFTFKTSLSSGAAYAVTIGTQPNGASCTISMGTGTIATANVTNVSIACTATAPTTYTIGGVVAGLGSGLSLTLLDNGGDAFTATANGAFAFKTPLANAASYDVTIGSQPPGETCTISNGSGSISSANVTSIAIACAATTSSSAWTWESGSNVADAVPVYGTKGTASTGNVPGARSDSATWTDAAGNLWLFGGDAFATGFLNDLWEYIPSADTWTWVGGANTGEPTGIYGTKGTASNDNVPGGRAFGASWIDAAGNLWLFGGQGEDSTGTFGYLNDLLGVQPRGQQLDLGEWLQCGECKRRLRNQRHACRRQRTRGARFFGLMDRCERQPVVVWRHRL